MKNALFLCFVSLMLISCGNETTVADTTRAVDSTITEKPIAEPKMDVPSASTAAIEALQGVYSKGGHDKSHLVMIKSQGGMSMAILIKIPGMLPSMEVLKSLEGPEGAEVVPLAGFSVDAEKGTFTSANGSGSIDGNSIVFSDLKDEAGEALALDKNDEYAFLLNQ